MESEVMERLKHFNLAEEEVTSFKLEQEDVKISKDACARSLIEKIYEQKMANFTGLRNTLRAIWVTAKPFKICELGPNLYQFTFELEEDKLKIFHGRPWVFDGSVHYPTAMGRKLESSDG